MTKIVSSKDFLMQLLFAKGHMGEQGESIRGRTRLMKMVFLFDKELKKKFNLNKVIDRDAIPKFEPYDFGPFSSKVFSDLDFLIELGFVATNITGNEEVFLEEAIEYEYWHSGSEMTEDSIGDDYREEEFSLTELGLQFVESGEAGKLTKEQQKALDEFKARCTRTPLRALLRYVYKKYPKMTTESKIRNEILSETS